MVNFSGIPEGESLGVDEDADYHIPLEEDGYGIPIYVVRVVLPGAMGFHFVNAIFLGDDITDAEQRTDFNNWYFWEPQNDSQLSIGSRGFPPGGAVYIVADENFSPDIPSPAFFHDPNLPNIKVAIIVDIPQETKGIQMHIRMTDGTEEPYILR